MAASAVFTLAALSIALGASSASNDPALPPQRPVQSTSAVCNCISEEESPFSQHFFANRSKFFASLPDPEKVCSFLLARSTSTAHSMSAQATNFAEIVERLKCRDPTFKEILFTSKRPDSELTELADCLLANPDVVTRVCLVQNRLTDKMGVKLARYVASSSTIESLDLSYNWLGPATYLAIAKALRVNKSLKYLRLASNIVVFQTLVDAAFVKALRLNPDRPAGSEWWLYRESYIVTNFSNDIDYCRLQKRALAAGPMSRTAASSAVQSSTGADERVQLEQLAEQDQEAAMQAQIRDVQASLEATQHKLRKYRRKSKERKARLLQESHAKSVAQAQLAKSAAEVQRLQQDNAALQAECDRLLAERKSC